MQIGWNRNWGTLITTIRTYAYALLDWLRFLEGADVAIGKAHRQHLTDYLIEYRQRPNRQRARRSNRNPLPPAGSINPVTGKTYLPDGYQLSTVNLRVTVIKLFYDFLSYAQLHPPGTGPFGSQDSGQPLLLLNRSRVYKAGARTRKRVPQRLAHALPYGLIQAVISAAACPRDAALIEGLYCTAARASELLALTWEDINWDERKAFLKTKGHVGKTAVGLSKKFLERLKAYQEDQGLPMDPQAPVWVTRRGPSQKPMNYNALRAVLRRINEHLGTNISPHDFRASSATHLAENPAVSLLYLKHHLRHSSLKSTQRYLDSARSKGITVIQKHFDSDQKQLEFKLHDDEYDQHLMAKIFSRGE